MPIIQYVLPSRNKQLKKLLHFYWEVCPKYDENGKLKQEMILVVYVFDIRSLFFKADHLLSNAIRNDLVSHNIPPYLAYQYSQPCLATSERIYPGRNPSIPSKNIQRYRASGTPHSHLPLLSRASSLLRPQKRCLCSIHHLPRVWTSYPWCPWTHADIPGGWVGRYM